MRTRIDMERLKLEIRNMTRTHLLYRVLRDELSTRGFWRKRERGNPAKGYQVMRERKCD